VVVVVGLLDVYVQKLKYWV